MAITAAVAAKREELVQSARLLGENLSRRTFGERGPDLQVTLADWEQFLRPLVAAMAGGFLAVSAEEQTERLPATLPCPTCGHECSREERERTIAAEQGPNRSVIARGVSGFLFPQRTALKIDQRDDSPAMIDKITFAGTGSESGQKACRALLKLAGLKISVMSVTNNEPRMNYAQHRQQGLPVTSCLVESLIQEINHRVKGTEQFWNRPTAAEGEAILQTVASLLSDGEPLSQHILNRPGGLYYRRSTAANLAAT